MSDSRKRKKSWREIDRGRDKTRSRRVGMPGTDPYSHRTNKSYKAELDRFFDKGVASDRIKHLVKQASADAPAEPEKPERVKLIRKVRTAATFDEFVKSVNELHTGDGLPNDVDVLVRCLEHPAEPVIQEALERLADLAKRVDLATMKSIKSRLVAIENVSDDQDTAARLETLRTKLWGDSPD